MGLFIIILYFIIFPFGQLLRFETSVFGIPFALHGLDIVSTFGILYVLLNHNTAHPLRKYFYYLWCVFAFSLLISFAYYPLPIILRGSLYLLRFISYYFFFELVWQICKTTEDRVQKVLLSSLLATAVFGWIQYMWLPDLRFLYYFNWDDHLYRLTGTILDPGFMGILMVFGALICTGHYLKTKRFLFLVLCLLFSATTLFTYSRASYLSLLTGVFALLYFHKKTQFIIFFLVIIFGSLFLLPKKEGEGVNLLRTNSIFQKATNYQETLEIISDFPVTGVGFNNLCMERIVRFDFAGFESHSCSGSDSSLLFVLATTGILGSLTFVSVIMRIPFYLTNSVHGEIFISSAFSLFVHSFFLNSLFYPWVLGVFVCLLALSVKENTKL